MEKALPKLLKKYLNHKTTIEKKIAEHLKVAEKMSNLTNKV